MRTIVALAGLIFVIGSSSPRSTYTNGCGPTPANWRTPRQGMGTFLDANFLFVMPDGALSWNGSKISEPRLIKYLGLVAKMYPMPVTKVEFSQANDCELVHRIRKIMVDQLDCAAQVCIEGSGKIWNIPDVLIDGRQAEPIDPDVLFPPTPR